MAIAGSGGWIPSIGITMYNGAPRLVGLPQNKPKEVVVPIERAVETLIEYPARVVQVEFRGSNLPTLLRMLSSVPDESWRYTQPNSQAPDDSPTRKE